ncbi:MAG: phosphoglucosamine mutase [Deltaproteobacteria bacterium]|nr:MAG: phosphoglucosamine mutase [Deltaproteobacteria bacterium]
MGRLFGTDGIRGRANEYPMTREMAVKIGRAAATVLGPEGGRAQIVIGRDTRSSGRLLEEGLVAGICTLRGNPLLAGILPTPGVAFLTREMKADAGIVISASHNPHQDNGIKIFNRSGLKLSREAELKIEHLVLDKNIAVSPEESTWSGKTYQVEDASFQYVDFLKHVPGHETIQGLSLVIDCANGATFQVAPLIFTELGAKVKTLFANPDGKNINDNCGSEYPQCLAREVVRAKADIGFAFDGDGDRVIAIDERGNVVRGDQILAVCAWAMKADGRLANNTVVSTVMSNIGLKLTLKRLGIVHVTTDVGDRYVLEEMVNRGACLGGEDSGHIIFLDHQTTGDGILTALRLANTMKRSAKPLSELATIMKIFPQCLINVEVKAKPPLEMVPEIATAVERAKTVLSDRGRVLVRYSGTQPMCRIMVEGPTREETESLCRQIAEVVREKLS